MYLCQWLLFVDSLDVLALGSKTAVKSAYILRIFDSCNNPYVCGFFQFCKIEIFFTRLLSPASLSP